MYSIPKKCKLNLKWTKRDSHTPYFWPQICLLAASIGDIDSQTKLLRLGFRRVINSRYTGRPQFSHWLSCGLVWPLSTFTAKEKVALDASCPWFLRSSTLQCQNTAKGIDSKGSVATQNQELRRNLIRMKRKLNYFTPGRVAWWKKVTRDFPVVKSLCGRNCVGGFKGTLAWDFLFWFCTDQTYMYRPNNKAFGRFRFFSWFVDLFKFFLIRRWLSWRGISFSFNWVNTKWDSTSTESTWSVKSS